MVRLTCTVCNSEIYLSDPRMICKHGHAAHVICAPDDIKYCSYTGCNDRQITLGPYTCSACTGVIQQRIQDISKCERQHYYHELCLGAREFTCPNPFCFRDDVKLDRPSH